jgi:hypothetical protein
MLAYIGMDNLSSLLIGYGFTYALYRLSGIESRLQLDNTALIQQARAVFPYFNHYLSSVPEALQTHIYQIHLATRFECHLQQLTQRYIALVYPNRFKRFLFKSFVEKKAEKYRDMGLLGYLLAHSSYPFSERVIYSMIDFNFSHIFKLSNDAVSSTHKIKAFKEVKEAKEVKKMNDIQCIEDEKKINKAKEAKEQKKQKSRE